MSNSESPKLTKSKKIRIISASLEKLIRHVQDQDIKIQEMESAYKTKIAELEKVVYQKNTELDQIKKALSVHDSQIQILDHNVHAPEQLDLWMQEEKNQSVAELAITPGKLGNQLNKFNSRIRQYRR